MRSSRTKLKLFSLRLHSCGCYCCFGKTSDDVTLCNFFPPLLSSHDLISPLVLRNFLFSLHLQPNALPSWCYASLLSAGPMNPCLRDTLRHLSRMCLDIPQQISLIKTWRDTDLNIFAAGGGLCVIFFPLSPSLAWGIRNLAFRLISSYSHTQSIFLSNRQLI